MKDSWTESCSYEADDPISVVDQSNFEIAWWSRSRRRQESNWSQARESWRRDETPNVSNSDNEAHICPSLMTGVIHPCKLFESLLTVPCPWCSIDRRSLLVDVARRSKSQLPRLYWRLNSIQTVDHHAPRSNPSLSFVPGPIRSTHLTLSTVIPNVDTIESWKAQGFCIETRITEWMRREWSEDLYLNQQKYKAIFTPKYCRISSGNEADFFMKSRGFLAILPIGWGLKRFFGHIQVSLSWFSCSLLCNGITCRISSFSMLRWTAINDREWTASERSPLLNYWETGPFWTWFHWESPVWAYESSREDGKRSIVVLECWRTDLHLPLLDAKNSRAGALRGNRSSALTFV